MAYGNWGAFVYKNGERMHDWEDATPYKEKEYESGYIQAFMRAKGRNPHHAVLGEKEVRLCGYKSFPVLFLNGKEIDLDDHEIFDSESYDKRYEGELNGYVFKARQYNGNMVDLELVEPDGTIWKSKCGYNFGSGH